MKGHVQFHEFDEEYKKELWQRATANGRKLQRHVEMLIEQLGAISIRSSGK